MPVIAIWCASGWSSGEADERAQLRVPRVLRPDEHVLKLAARSVAQRTGYFNLDRRTLMTSGEVESERDRISPRCAHGTCQPTPAACYNFATRSVSIANREEPG